MSEPFFGLDSSPFGLTPDPRFLFRSRVHHEILSLLLYGVTTGKGVMLLLGDVGTGKTTLCRALLRELPAEAQSVLLLNPHLSETELVGAILDDLGLERRGSTRGELMTVLSQHLLAAGGEGKSVVIVVDEAQHMSVEALEQVRILSTLEAPDRKLLQIVLAGQPELEAKLARPELRQLTQRIGVRCHLRPLAERETFRYVEHRLRAAGLGGSLPFTWAATARVHRHSGGVPRVINLVCDRSLSAAFAGRRRNVDVDTVKAAIRSLQGRPTLARWVKSVAVAAVAVVAVGGMTLGLQRTWRQGGFVPRTSNRVLAPAASAAAPAPPPSSAPLPATAATPALPPPAPAPRARLGSFQRRGVGAVAESRSAPGQRRAADDTGDSPRCRTPSSQARPPHDAASRPLRRSTRRGDTRVPAIDGPGRGRHRRSTDDAGALPGRGRCGRAEYQRQAVEMSRLYEALTAIERKARVLARTDLPRFHAETRARPRRLVLALCAVVMLGAVGLPITLLAPPTPLPSAPPLPPLPTAPPPEPLHPPEC